MSTGIQALREKRAALTNDIRKLLDDNPASKWDAATHQPEFDRLEHEISALDRQVGNYQTALNLEADERIDGRIREHSAKTQRDLPDADPRRIYDTWLRGGDKSISAEQWQIVRNTLSTTTGSEGGYAVPNLIASQLIDSMKAFGTMRRVAEVIATADGRPLSYPASDGTAEVGEWIGQNTTATSADPTFGTVSLNVFKASSKIVAAPIELLQDATIDMEGFIRRRLAQRLGRVTNAGFTTGSGTTQPDGIVPRAGAGKVGATGQTTTIIYDDLIDLVHAVDPAYRGGRAAFMTSDAMLRVLRKLKDTAGRPIWMPSYDTGIAQLPRSAQQGGFTAEESPAVYDFLLGYPVYVNNDMAAPAASAKSMLFGDLSYYKIRDAMDVLLFRFTDSAYAKLGQVGFLAWLRTGGNLVDTAAVKYYQNSAT